MVKKNKKKIIILAIVVCIVGYIGYSTTKAANTKPNLAVAAAGLNDIKTEIALTGTVKQGETQDYISTGSALIEEVNFKMGDEVKKGDVIVAFDNQDAMDIYKEAAIRYEKQRLMLTEKERSYFDILEDIEKEEEYMAHHKDKMEEFEWAEGLPMTGPDAAAASTYELYRGKYEASRQKKESLEKSIPSDEAIKIDQLDFELAKMSLDDAEKQIAELPKNITAEFDGVIEQLTAKELNTTAKGQVLLSLKSTETNKIEMSVGKYDVSKVQVGQKVVIKLGNDEFTGKVSEIAATAGTDSSVKATVEVEASEKPLIPGMSVDVDVLIYEKIGAMSIPIEAVKTDVEGDYCYIIELADAEKNLYKATKTYIKIGNSSDTHTEVLEGLSEGQQIVKNPPNTIAMIPLFTITDLQ